MSRKYTHEEFENKLKEVSPHLKVASPFIGLTKPIIVIDSLGIQYKTTPRELLKYKTPIMQSAVDKNTAFEIRASIKHNNFYDYSLVDYTINKNKVTIICPIHGEFEQCAANHLNGSKCPKCVIEEQSKKKKKSHKQFEQEFYLQHSTLTLLSKYKTVNQEVLVKDELDIVYRASPAHLLSGVIPSIQTAINSTEAFKIKANLVHKNKYNYSKSNYTISSNKIEIICNNHGSFFQAAHSHLMGIGCPKCGKLTGYSREQWISFCEDNNKVNPKVYIIRLFNNNENFIKIGMTSNSVHKRFPNKATLPYEYEILKEIKGSPAFVYDKEKELHNLFKNYMYKPNLSFGGETECFTIEILPLIKAI